MSHLPYRQLLDGQAAVEEPVLIAAFTHGTATGQLSGDERFCTFTFQGASWTVVNINLLSTVTADENGYGNPITRIVNRKLTDNELSAFLKATELHGLP